MNPRGYLERIMQATEGITTSSGFWVGDTAGERQTLDDVRAGRRSLLSARRAAQLGIERLDNNDRDAAMECLVYAMDNYICAITARLSADDARALTRGANRRGRTALADRDRRFAEAVAEQVEGGLKGKRARRAALEADPQLAEAFAGVSDARQARILTEQKKRT